MRRPLSPDRGHLLTRLPGPQHQLKAPNLPGMATCLCRNEHLQEAFPLLEIDPTTMLGQHCV